MSIILLNKQAAHLLISNNYVNQFEKEQAHRSIVQQIIATKSSVYFDNFIRFIEHLSLSVTMMTMASSESRDTGLMSIFRL